MLPHYDDKKGSSVRARRLREFLAREQNKLLLLPENIDPGAKYFRLSSGILQNRFISAWPLIEDLELFEEASRFIGEALAEICERIGTKIIVGCTMTVRHLFDGIREHLPEGFRIEYLGNFPLLPLPPDVAADLAASRVLIFTDVISTGQLVDDTAAFLKAAAVDVGGVVALLGAVRSKDAPTPVTGERRGLLGGPIAGGLPITTFLDVQVDVRDPDETVLAIQTDPLTVYPQSPLHSDPVFERLASLENEAELMAAAGELQIGYFRAGQDRFTVHFDLQKVMRRHAELLGERIRAKIESLDQSFGTPVLVTTPTPENREFLKLVQHELGKFGKTPPYVLFSRTDEFDGSYSYLLLGPDEKVRSRPAIVLLSTIQATETVRALSAVLSLHDCPDVTIFCAINRTSAPSASFLARVLKLRSSRSSPKIVGQTEKFDDSARRENEGHRFELISLLRAWDLSAADLSKMESLAQLQFQTFWGKCSSEIMRSMSLVDLKYFSPAPVWKTYLAAQAAGRISEPKSADEDAQICLRAKQAIVERRPGALIELISNQDLSKGGLFSIFRYLLADWTALSKINNRVALSESLVLSLASADRAISDACKDDPQLASKGVRTVVLNAIAWERRLLIGVGLFSQFLAERTNQRAGLDVARTDVRARIVELLRAMSAGDGPQALASLVRLADLEWSYALTFAMRLLDFEERPESSRVIADFKSALEHIRDAASGRINGTHTGFPTLQALSRLWRIEGPDVVDSTVLMPLVAAVSGVFDALSAEEPPNAGQCIAAIRREIAWPRPRHSFCASALFNSPRKIAAIYREQRDEALDKESGDHGPDVTVHLNNLIYATSKLERLIPLIRRLIIVTLENSEWTSFFRTDEEANFSGQLRTLADVAQRVRNRHVANAAEVDQIKAVAESLLIRIWGNRRPHASANEEQSGFFNFVAQFECDVVEKVRAAIDIAKARMGDGVSEDGPQFDVKLQVDRRGDDDSPIITLIDPTLLQMAFENYIANFRHSDGWLNKSAGYAGEITVEDTIEGFVTVAFRSLGENRGPRRRIGVTMHDHQRRLEEFDCAISEDNRGGEFIVKVRLPRVQQRARE